MMDKLIEIHDLERKGKFAEIDDSFFRNAKEYIRSLEEKLMKTDDEYETSRIEDELNTAKILLRRIFERRFSRIVRLAMYKVLNMDAEINGVMTEREKEFYEKLIEIMKEFKEDVLG